MVDDALKDAVEATRRAAKDLADAASSLARKVGSEVDRVMKDSSGDARDVSDRINRDLQNLKKEIDRILRDL